MADFSKLIQISTPLKYPILIVDDEDSGRQSLKILLEKVFRAYIQKIDFAKSFAQAREMILEKEYQLIFLDINLKGISAFDLLKFIPPQAKIIFVTAYSEFMLQALRSKAFDYLVKPVKEEELDACLQRILQEQAAGGEQHTIHIRAGGMTRLIEKKDILYIEGDGPYSSIILKTEVIKTARTLKSMMAELDEQFIRIHKSYVVNKKYIRAFNMDKLILNNDQCLPVSRTGYKNLSA